MIELRMKKVAASLITGATFLATTGLAFAADQIPIQVGQPSVGINPATAIGTLLSNALTIVFVAAALAVLFFLIIGAFRWITSSGEKESIGKARGTIVNALIGLAILALAFLIVVVVGRVLNINILDLRFIPSLDRCVAGQKFDPVTGTCVPINQAPGTTQPGP